MRIIIFKSWTLVTDLVEVRVSCFRNNDLVLFHILPNVRQCRYLYFSLVTFDLHQKRIGAPFIL